MVQTLIERARNWLYATFPERQIYIRSDGRVQFFTFGAPLQATSAGIALIFLGWVAFASVNVIFKDHIIVVKDHRYQQMQANYENRLADLQMSYDELNGALVGAEDKFRSVANQLQLKQQAIGSLFTRRNVLNAATSVMAAGTAAPGSAAGVAETFGFTSAGSATNFGANGTSEMGILPGPVQPQPRTSAPTRASLLDGAVRRFASAASALLRHPRTDPVHHLSPEVLRNPGFRALAEQTNRIEKMNRVETGLLQNFDSQIAVREANVEGLIRRVGLNPERVKGHGMGGPLLPLSDTRVAGISDPAFTSAFALTSAHSEDLEQLFAALTHVPLTTPVHGAGFELTSDFGPRIDPFTHHAGFHPGLDFGGPWGATVSATAPGTVVFAGPRGGYGNMVEIDHGFGMHTRYGHLSSILVHPGATVAKGTPVGRLGSTGRSTGPHVHYEVWLADAVRDPSRFIEAGRHVQ
jgi:murein DD-endopeptidase MepM/ murein hydrolase activator NlpD